MRVESLEIDDKELLQEIHRNKRRMPAVFQNNQPQKRVSSPAAGETAANSNVVTSGKRRNQMLEQIEMTDPKSLTLNMAVRRRDQK